MSGDTDAKYTIKPQQISNTLSVVENLKYWLKSEEKQIIIQIHCQSKTLTEYMTTRKAVKNSCASLYQLNHCELYNSKSYFSFIIEYEQF